MGSQAIKILLIEDNADDAKLIQHQLSKTLKFSFTLQHVIAIHKGLEALQQERFDVVLLDLNLPDGSGISTVDAVSGQATEVPIIVLTGNDNDEVGVEAVKKGAQDYLIKGKVDDDLLARSISYAIERKKLLTQLEHSRREVKTLKGFLPICANCKKIRDDKGYWTQIETYISAQTDAAFSHGICPDCSKKLYGEYFNKKK